MLVRVWGGQGSGFRSAAGLKKHKVCEWAVLTPPSSSVEGSSLDSLSNCFSHNNNTRVKMLHISELGSLLQLSCRKVEAAELVRVRWQGSLF